MDGKATGLLERELFEKVGTTKPPTNAPLRIPLRAGLPISYIRYGMTRRIPHARRVG